MHCPCCFDNMGNLERGTSAVASSGFNLKLPLHPLPDGCWTHSRTPRNDITSGLLPPAKPDQLHFTSRCQTEHNCTSFSQSPTHPYNQTSSRVVGLRIGPDRLPYLVRSSIHKSDQSLVAILFFGWLLVTKPFKRHSPVPNTVIVWKLNILQRQS